MPIYEYICNKCNDRFSLLQSMSAAEKETQCLKCGSTEVKKLISSFSTSSTSSSGKSSPAHSCGGGGG